MSRSTALRPPVGPHDLDAMSGELSTDESARVIVSRPADEPRVLAEVGDPGGDIRCLPSGSDPDLGGHVAPGSNRPGEADDHVERQISKRADEHCDGDRKIRP